MRALILILVIFIQGILLQAQNLAPNPSFEDTVHCPTGISQMSYAVGWYSPTGATPDYCNSCNNGMVGVPQNWAGREYAKSGVAYAGIYTGGRSPSLLNYREYIQAKLIDTLIAGAKYSVSFYVSLGDSCGYAYNNIGAYFSPTAISIFNPAYPYIPQIANTSANPLINKNGWTLIADTFTAVGGELYITIGNFNDAAHSDTVFVGGGSIVYTVISYYYIDDVSVRAKDSFVDINENDFEKSISIYPNPADEDLTIELKTQNENVQFQITDLFGKEIINEKILNGRKQMDVRDLKQGIYSLRLKTDKGSFVKKIIIQHPSKQ